MLGFVNRLTSTPTMPKNQHRKIPEDQCQKHPENAVSKITAHRGSDRQAEDRNRDEQRHYSVIQH